MQVEHNHSSVGSHFPIKVHAFVIYDSGSNEAVTFNDVREKPELYSCMIATNKR